MTSTGVPPAPASWEINFKSGSIFLGLSSMADPRGVVKFEKVLCQYNEKDVNIIKYNEVFAHNRFSELSLPR